VPGSSHGPSYGGRVDDDGGDCHPIVVAALSEKTHSSSAAGLASKARPRAARLFCPALQLCLPDRV